MGKQGTQENLELCFSNRHTIDLGEIKMQTLTLSKMGPEILPLAHGAYFEQQGSGELG